MHKTPAIPGLGKHWKSLVRRWAKQIARLQQGRSATHRAGGLARAQMEIATPELLARLTSYARSVTGKEVECRWGNGFYTDLENVIVLDPHYPPKASTVDRKIVLNSRLEHELRGHWQYTPRDVFQAVCEWAENKTMDPDSYWETPEVARYRPAARSLFSILEDGRVETRLRWSQPEAYRIIAAGDLVSPRWAAQSSYPPAARAYFLLKRKLGNEPLAECPSCGKHLAPEGMLCESCFTANYRWEQVTGLLLTAAIPPHTSPLSIVEQEVREVFGACLPRVLFALQGTARDAFESTREILRILIDHNMVSVDPQTQHLEIHDATGQSDVADTSMSVRIGRMAGLNDPAEPEHQASSGVGAAESSAQEAKDKASVEPRDAESQDQSWDKRTMPHSRQDSPSVGDRASANTLAAVEELARKDLQDCDFAIALRLEHLREADQRELDAAVEEQAIAALLAQVLAASGVARAGPGLDIDIHRTDPNAAVYQSLRLRNMEHGRRLAREIEDLMASVMRPERFRRSGRLDRSQLVNAVARRRDTVFTKPKPHRQLDLALSILVDVSGSMAAFNRPFSSIPFLRPTGSSDPAQRPAQLSDAVVTCTLALTQLGGASEVRAFGDHQWLVKGFYDAHPDYLGGLPGIDNGGTRMSPAIRYARLALLGRDEQDRLMVVMTDGYPFDVDEAVSEVRLARSLGIRVLGILFANESQQRSTLDPAMARIFGPGSFAVIHSLDMFPREVGRAIKDMLRRSSR